MDLHYIQASLVAEMGLIEMLDRNMRLREKIAEKYGLDVSSIRKSRRLPEFTITYQPTKPDTAED